MLATGVPDAGRTRWQAEAVRDVAVSIGHFRIARPTSAGVHITVGVSNDVEDNAASFAEQDHRRLTQFAASVRAVPGLHLHGGRHARSPRRHRVPDPRDAGANTNGRTTTHEIAHQWFYALVGNNQGRDPWLDEGLATYAEGRAEGNLACNSARHAAAPWPPRVADDVLERAPTELLPRRVHAGGHRRWRRWARSTGWTARCGIYVARNAYRIARPTDLIDALIACSPTPDKLARYGVTSTP